MPSIFLLCLLYLFVDFGSSCKNCGKLKKLFVVFGHGEQGPVICPNDPNRDYQWSAGLGNLTMNGKNQAFDLGSYLRHQYKDYLTFNPDEVFARSAETWRCIQTTRCVLNGIYNPSDRANCYNETGFTDAPMYTVKPDNYDHMLAPHMTCPKYTEWQRRDDLSLAHNKTVEKYEEVIEELRNLTGCSNLTYDLVYMLYNTLTVEEANNLTIPSWFYRLRPQMEEINLDYYDRLSKYKEGARLQSGVLLHDMIVRMTDGNKKSEKILLYGTQVSMLMSTMKLLQIFNGFVPPYATAIIIEVNRRRRRRRSQDYIDIFYRNSSSRAPYKMPIGGCSDPCLVQDFIRLTKEFVIANPEEACKMP